MAGKDTVEINGFERAIQSALGEFRTATSYHIHKATDKTTREVIKRTRAASPRRYGYYQKGWTSRIYMRTMFHYSHVIYNKEQGALTHLLQWGHGGPVPGPAIPHITPDDETQQIFETALRKELEG